MTLPNTDIELGEWYVSTQVPPKIKWNLESAYSMLLGIRAHGIVPGFFDSATHTSIKNAGILYYRNLYLINVVKNLITARKTMALFVTEMAVPLLAEFLTTPVSIGVAHKENIN